MAKYRIRIIELNNGVKKFYPEVKIGGFLNEYLQIVTINNNIARVANMKEFFNITIEEAESFIERDKDFQKFLISNEIKETTIVDFEPKIRTLRKKLEKVLLF